MVDLRTGWVIGFSGMRTLPAYVDWLIDQPISVAPLQRVPEQARAAAVEAMRGQPREVVRDAAHGAVRDANFLVELVLKLNVAAEETIQLLGLPPRGAVLGGAGDKREAHLQTSRGLRSTSPTARWAAWRGTVVSPIGSLYSAGGEG